MNELTDSGLNKRVTKENSFCAFIDASAEQVNEVLNYLATVSVRLDGPPIPDVFFAQCICDGDQLSGDGGYDDFVRFTCLAKSICERF